MVNFDVNSEEGRRITHGFYQTYHREASAADIRRDMGDARVGSSAGSGSNIVRNGLYRETTDNRGTRYSKCVKEIRATMGVDEGGRIGGAKRRQRSNFR